MLVSGILILGGLAALIIGGESVVRGATWICSHFGVSKLVVGLIVVAFGTSVPELAVNLTAAFQGQGELCFGNIIGSNIANIGLILGTAALIRPLAIASIVVSREIPMLIVVSAAAVALGFDRFFSGGPDDFFSRGDAVVLLLLFAAFLYHSTMDVVNGKNSDLIEAAAPSGVEPREIHAPTIPRSAGMVLVGFILLAVGGKLTVDGAVGVARFFGIGEALIGLTIVAVGTSLPELVTSLIAVRHGEVNMAVGNVVGSNLFNLLFILGVSSLVQPVPIPAGEGSALPMMAVLTLLLWPITHTDQRKVIRWEGAALLVLYSAYMLSRSLPALT